MEDIYALRPGEYQDDYLYRLGTYKETGTVQATWLELTDILNQVLRPHLHPWDESSWRKRYRRLRADPAQVQKAIEREEEQQEPEEVEEDNIEMEEDFEMADFPLAHLSELKRERALINDMRSEQNRVMRCAARAQSLQEIMQQEIKRFPAPEIHEPQFDQQTSHALYAMLSDIHYGIEFSGKAGSYSPELARSRVMQYADRICQIGFENDIDTVYVSLMGDMISGIIHQTTRLENREDLIHQIVGASELVAEFLYALARNFKAVIVNSVPGNHSRVDKSFDDAARGEKLDDLITWYCKTKLENVNHVMFVPNLFDATIGVHEIFGKTYVCVHGDFDTDLHMSAMRLNHLMGTHIDYLLAGHLHVPDIRFEYTGYIRNGSICGSGDEYTMKKRLYSPPYQVCMAVSERGIDAVYPICLDENEAQK